MAEQKIRNVGYIGMGIMGAPMAGNLIKAGFDVSVTNRTLSKCEPLEKQGAKVADSPAALADRGLDVILINVTDTPDVEQIIFGEQGIFTKAKPGLIVIDNSTINPIATREFAGKLAEKNVTLLDAPVSGGDVGAQNGTLSIMVGGPEDAYEKCLPVFQAMGKNINRVGEVGSGQVCKACNQVCVVGTLAAVCEALTLAKKTGLDLGKMIDVVSGGAGGSWQLANLGPRIAKGDFDPGFMVDLVLKDLGIIGDTARDLRLPLAVTALAESHFRGVASNGGGRLGTQAMAKVYEMLGDFEFES